MKLLTQEIIKKLPKLYAQENNKDPDVICKFFTPDSSWTWYVLEGQVDVGDPMGGYVFFGYVKGFEDELGYFTQRELESARGPLGLKIERDLYFPECKLSQVKSGEVS